MKQSAPKYRINYRFCPQPLHSDQKTNLVCLSSDCQSNPLICSFCQQDKHKGHTTKPLKHFLSDLEKHYTLNQSSTVNQELQELEESKLLWMNRIKNLVENLAQHFMKLQQQVIDKYETMKGQIFQREAKRSRFNAFYDAMANQGKGDPNFQIQNYLHFEPLEVFDSPEHIIDSLTSNWPTVVQKMKDQLTILKKDSVFVQRSGISQTQIIPNPTFFNKQFMMPKSIKRIGDCFIQTEPDSKETLGHLDVLLKNWTGKLKIRIVSLKPNAKFAIGVAKVTDLATAKTVQELKKKPGVFYLDSNGVAQNQEYNHSTVLKAGDTLLAFVKKSNFKISPQKNTVCCHHLKTKEDNVVYFSLEGGCQIQMVYPYYKNNY